MLLSDDKKKTVSLLVSKLGKPQMEESPMKDGAEQDDSMPKDAAAEELIAAIESKSAKGVVEALESLMELCSPKSEPTESEME